MPESEKKEKERYCLEEIPTQTAIIIRDTETKETYNVETALVRVLNNQEKILQQIK